MKSIQKSKALFWNFIKKSTGSSILWLTDTCSFRRTIGFGWNLSHGSAKLWKAAECGEAGRITDKHHRPCKMSSKTEHAQIFWQSLDHEETLEHMH